MAGETVIGTGDPLAIKLYSVTLQAETSKLSVFARMMTGKAPTERGAIAKRRSMQTTSDMPIVVITDLQKTSGDRVTCDMFKMVRGKPIMGDKTMEGRGQPLRFSSMEVVINQTRFPVNAGSRMTRKRTKHNLRAIARGEMADYFARLNDQIIQVHMAGARGDEDTEDWNVPPASDPDFADIMVNPVEAPTANRYFVAGGGSTVGDLGTTDALKLEDIDVIVATLRDMTFPPQPIRVDSDPLAQELPIWCLLVTERQWHYIITRSGGGDQNWRKAVADASKRSMLSKHPLFTGEGGIWNSVLIKRMPRAIRFGAGTMVNVTNSTTGVESGTAVPSGITVDRAILLGGQALALAKGDAGGAGPGTGPFPTMWSEVLRDHGNTIEIGAGQMDGKRKFRFTGTDGQITDFGICAIDSYAPEPQSTAGATLRTALAT